MPLNNPIHNLSIAVTAQNPAFSCRARDLAGKLQIPFTKNGGKYQWLLYFSENGIGLIHQGSPQVKGCIRVDFTDAQALYRRKQAKKEILAQAVGCKKGKTLSVVDGTGGLGRDSFILATAGCRVTVFERHPVIAALLADGLTRANATPLTRDISRYIHLINDNFVSFRQYHQDLGHVDVVYLDPMFPARKKSAKVKKELQTLQMLAEIEDDFTPLLHTALSMAVNRVVVKRPRKAPPLTNIVPSHSINAKTIRFDVYIINNLPAVA